MIDREMIRGAVSALVERLVVYLPTLATALLFLAVGWIVSRLLGSAVRRMLKRFGLDQAVERAGLEKRLEDAKISQPLSEILGRAVFWIVFLFVLVLTVQRLGIDLSAVPVERLLAYLPRAFGAVLLLVVGLFAAQLLGRAADAGSASLGVDVHRTVGRLVRALIVLMTFVLTVDQLGFDVGLLSGTVQNLVTIVVAGVVVTFAIGGRDVARNALSGYYAKDFLRVGDRIEVDGLRGTIEAIHALNAEVETENGTVFVPNSQLVSQRVKKLSFEE